MSISGLVVKSIVAKTAAGRDSMGPVFDSRLMHLLHFFFFFKNIFFGGVNRVLKFFPLYCKVRHKEHVIVEVSDMRELNYRAGIH